MKFGSHICRICLEISKTFSWVSDHFSQAGFPGRVPSPAQGGFRIEIETVAGTGHI